MPKISKWLLVCVTVVILAGLKNSLATPMTNSIPVCALSLNGFIRDWLVVGPFPNFTLPVPASNGVTRTAFDHDFLAAIGGESHAVFSTDTILQVEDAAGASHIHQPIWCSATDKGYVDLAAAFKTTNSVAAYAFARLTTPIAQRAFFHFGSDDSAKIWVNGRLAHSIWVKGREARPWSEDFSADLQVGTNTLLVKIENATGGWGFYCEAYERAEHDALQRQREARNHLMFPDELDVRPVGGYLWPTGQPPPRVVWKNQEFAQLVFGPVALTTRWFDTQDNAVTVFNTPGRYMAFSEGRAASGRMIRRAFTCFAYPREWQTEITNPDLVAHWHLPAALGSNVVAVLASQTDADATQAVSQSFRASQAYAVLLAGLYEQRDRSSPYRFIDSPRVAALDVYVALKRNLLGLCEHYPGLIPPRRVNDNAPVLRAGTSTDAGIRKENIAAIRKACEEWFAEENEPFNVCIARNGVIFYAAAFGQLAGQPVTQDSAFHAASVSKAVTGTLFARFIDQHLFKIDDPIGIIFPDWPTNGVNAVTFRDCFVHLHGYNQRYQVGGDVEDCWYESNVAHVEPDQPRGTRMTYSGTGFALAAKAMELASGKSYYRLLQEDLFDPLELRSARPGAPDGGMWFSAHDLAIIGMLLLNQGRYGGLEFFNTETFEQICPQPLAKFYPSIQAENGLGLWWFHQHDHFPEPVASPHTLGHGASSGTILRVDLDNNTVITLARNRTGRNYEAHAFAFLKAAQQAIMAR